MAFRWCSVEPVGLGLNPESLRVMAPSSPYTLRLEMTGARFEVTAPLDTLPLEERHQIAAQVALADRLSFALSLPVMGDEIEGGARYETSDGDGVVVLALGSRRDEGEPATDADNVQPQSIGKDRGWALSVESISAADRRGARAALRDPSAGDLAPHAGPERELDRRPQRDGGRAGRGE